MEKYNRKNAGDTTESNLLLACMALCISFRLAEEFNSELIKKTHLPTLSHFWIKCIKCPVAINLLFNQVPWSDMQPAMVLIHSITTSHGVQLIGLTHCHKIWRQPLAWRQSVSLPPPSLPPSLFPFLPLSLPPPITREQTTAWGCCCYVLLLDFLETSGWLLEEAGSWTNYSLASCYIHPLRTLFTISCTVLELKKNQNCYISHHQAF